MKKVSLHAMIAVSLAACGPVSAIAGSVWINGAGLQSLSLGAAVGGQRFEASGSGGRMVMHNGVNGTARDQFSQDVKLASTAGIGFRIEHFPSQGYKFTLAPTGSNHALVWGQDIRGSGLILEPGDEPGNHPEPPGFSAGAAKSTVSLNGHLANARAFNSLQIEARAGSDSAALSFSNLTFSSFGALNVAAGSLTSNAAVTNQTQFLDGRTATQSDTQSGQLWQTIVSDANLSLLNWTLSGTLTLGTGLRDRVYLEVIETNAEFVSVVPLPTAEWAGLATMASGLCWARCRRRLG